MEEKKNTDHAPAIGDEELDNVSGGLVPIDSATWYAHGNAKDKCTCWVCKTEYWYAPGKNINDPNDPMRHFCCDEHKRVWDSTHEKGNWR